MWNLGLQPLKTLYLLYCNAYRHRSGQDGDLPWGTLPTKSRDPLTTWSPEITWQTKFIIYPPPQCLWLPKWAGWWPTWRGSYSEFHMTLWSRDLAKLCGKLKALHLHNRSVCDHQTWQGGDLPWGAPTNSCGSWVAWSWEITRQIKNISYYHNAYGHQIWQVDWLTTIGSYL